MPGSNRQMNVRNVVFTPVSGTAIQLSGVTSVSLDAGGELQKFAGDGDHYNTLVVNAFSDPTITIAGSGLQNLPATGARGTLAFTFKDARSPNSSVVGPGDITYTVVTAVVGNNSVSGQFKQFATANVTIGIESSDGVTSPISILIQS